MFYRSKYEGNLITEHSNYLLTIIQAVHSHKTHENFVWIKKTN